jgi:hypothetical protein
MPPQTDPKIAREADEFEAALEDLADRVWTRWAESPADTLAAVKEFKGIRYKDNGATPPVRPKAAPQPPADPMRASFDTVIAQLRRVMGDAEALETVRALVDKRAIEQKQRSAVKAPKTKAAAPPDLVGLLFPNAHEQAAATQQHKQNGDAAFDLLKKGKVQ